MQIFNRTSLLAAALSAFMLGVAPKASAETYVVEVTKGGNVVLREEADFIDYINPEDTDFDGNIVDGYVMKAYKNGRLVMAENSTDIDYIKIFSVDADRYIDPNWQLVPMPDDMVPDKRVHAYKDKLYDNLFTRTVGWNGGDGVQTTGLPGGHLFWSFNDSFYGVVDGETRNRDSSKNNFPRNSIMVQKADRYGFPGSNPEDQLWLADWIQTSNPNGNDYYRARTHIRNPKATLTEAAIQKGDIDQDWIYWAGDATVSQDGSKMQMIWTSVDNRDGNMINCGQALATYSLCGKPGDDTYMKMVDVNHWFKPYNKYNYGMTMWEDEDGYTYLYCAYNIGYLEQYPFVARVKGHDLNGLWEYYVQNNRGDWQWQTAYPSNEDIKRSYIANHTTALPWVFKKGDWYYMVSQTFPFGSEYIIMRSRRPEGPFMRATELMKFPKELDKLGTKTFRYTYMVHYHPALSRNGELVITTNTDTQRFSTNFNAEGSADFYRPFFYRIFDWERVFEDAPELPVPDVEVVDNSYDKVYITVPANTATVEVDQETGDIEIVVKGTSCSIAFDIDNKLNLQPGLPARRTLPAEGTYVDLGLPSGTLWATCNVGASTPEESGIYLAWGETAPKASYTADTAQRIAESTALIEAGILDITSKLNLPYDAAYVHLGSAWRMPTQAEMKELVENCTSERINDGTRNGLEFTGKNGNKVFFPAAGRMDGTAIKVTTNGQYWTSSGSTTGTQYAFRLDFNSGGNPKVGTDSRMRGMTVRPVVR